MSKHLPEIVDDGITGLSFEKDNARGSLLTNSNWFMSDRNLREKMGANANKWVL